MMNWTDTIRNWRRLPEQEQMRRRWEAIPLDVAQSMAFEREPVSLNRLQEIHARIEPPALLKQHAAFSPIPK